MHIGIKNNYNFIQNTSYTNRHRNISPDAKIHTTRIESNQETNAMVAFSLELHPLQWDSMNSE